LDIICIDISPNQLYGVRSSHGVARNNIFIFLIAAGY